MVCGCPTRAFSAVRRCLCFLLISSKEALGLLKPKCLVHVLCKEGLCPSVMNLPEVLKLCQSHPWLCKGESMPLMLHRKARDPMQIALTLRQQLPVAGGSSIPPKCLFWASLPGQRTEGPGMLSA